MTTTQIYTFPYTTLFRSLRKESSLAAAVKYARLLCWSEKHKLQNSRKKKLRSRSSATHFAPNATKRKQRSKSLRSEEHTSELQSHSDLVCRLLLEKKKEK